MSDFTDDFDARMMHRAIRLAMNGRGSVEPNPMVGCVLVKDGRIIAEGYHAKFGGAHAEPTAIASASESPVGATAYVTLEPCCHLNKKTPPCVPALIAAKIARVVIGALDPNPEVNGKGIEQLRDAGIEVQSGVLANAAGQLLGPFLAGIRHQRPYVTLKWAQTADGKVAGPGGQRLQITARPATQLVHELRSRCDSILVGINTVLADNPRLTARYANHPRDPARFILDTSLRTPPDAQLVAGGTIFHAVPTDEAFVRRREALLAAGANLIALPTAEGANRLSLPYAIRRVHDELHYDLLIEPGPTLARALFDQGNLVDRLWIMRSPKQVNDPTAPSAIEVPGQYVRTGELRIGDDTLTEYLNPQSDVYFAAEPSADFILAAKRIRGAS
jgi:diaminohydroxyphosphoribosylaminopyrimidine deaminase/5-amino-6-(5-phosphoribosylamino)uracil reductase